MNPSEKELELLNQGRMADLAYSVIRPLLEKMKLDVLANIRMAYLDPKTEDKAIIRYCAELSAIDSLTERIESKMRVAKKISERLNNDDDGN